MVMELKIANDKLQCGKFIIQFIYFKKEDPPRTILTFSPKEDPSGMSH